MLRRGIIPRRGTFKGSRIFLGVLIAFFIIFLLQFRNSGEPSDSPKQQDNPEIVVPGERIEIRTNPVIINDGNDDSKNKTPQQTCTLPSHQQYVFGLGPGKCGTHVIAALLDAQTNSSISHERGGCTRIPWEPVKLINGLSLEQSRAVLFEAQAKRIFNDSKRTGHQFIGDVAMYWLPYVEVILQKIPTAKFIAVRRNREKTIKSWMTWVPETHHWVNDPQRLGYKRLGQWDPCYPKLGIDNRTEAIAAYYDLYYDTVGKLMKKYPDNIKLIDIEVVEPSEEEQDQLMAWVGMCPPYKRIPPPAIRPQDEKPKESPKFSRENLHIPGTKKREIGSILKNREEKEPK